MKKIFTLLFFALAISANAQCWDMLASKNLYVAGIKADKTLWKWGGNNNSPYQLGTDNDWDWVSMGADFMVAIKSNGTLWALSLGTAGNTHGQLGQGDTGSHNGLVQIGNQTNWSTVNAGAEHVVARKSDGSLWTWGVTAIHLSGGIVVDSFLTTPTQIGTATDWNSAKLSAGGYHTLAVKSNGTLWGWGNNSMNQLGNGNTTSTTTPIQIGIDTDWKDTDAGQGSSYAIKNNGKLYAWGIGDERLGLGNISTNVAVPTQVGTDTNWSQVKGGNTQTLGFKTTGAMYAWGKNTYGSLGDGTTINRSTPVQVTSTSDWIGGVAGDEQFYAAKTDGTGIIYVVGTNTYGSLGDGTNTNRTVFTPLTCPTSVLQTEAFEAKTGFAIYPNPVSSILNIQTSNNVAITKITISDLTGKVMLTQTRNTNQVDVATLANGIYIIEAISEADKFTSKLIKK